MQDISERAWPVFAGVDWGGENHQLCVVAPDGKRLLETRVSHDVAGLRQLDQHLSGFGAQVPVAIERAEGLLVEHLQATGHAVFPVSPRISARARERYKVAAVKDDRFDAFVLADTLRFDHAHWRLLSIPSPLLAEIKALTRDRDRLLETQQATESQLRMILEAYHPAPVRLFSSVDRQITLSFVTDYPTPANASRVKTTRMAGFLSRHHYTGRVPAQTLADRMRQNLLSTAEHPDAPIFASFPGIGPVLTAVLLAEIGEDRARFPHAEVLLAEAGLAPVTRSSGRSRSVRFRYAANSRLREATMWWAFNSIKMSPWAAAAFRDAREQKGQRYHRALRGLAARWTRILWRCWTNHETYDPARHGSAALIAAA